jgi:hypothetical protein
MKYASGKNRGDKKCIKSFVGKGKAIPLQAWKNFEGSEAPRF